MCVAGTTCPKPPSRDMITDQSKEDFMMEFFNFFLIERLADTRINVLHKLIFLFKDKIISFFYILSLNSGF